MEDSETDGFVSTPVYVWRSIEAVTSVKTVVSRTADRAYMEGRSFLFSRCAALEDRPDAEFLIDWVVSRVREANGVSARSLTYINERSMSSYAYARPYAITRPMMSSYPLPVVAPMPHMRSSPSWRRIPQVATQSFCSTCCNRTR